MTGGDGTDTDESELTDYNEQEAVETAEKAAAKKALKEMLTNNGFTLINLLRSVNPGFAFLTSSCIFQFSLTVRERANSNRRAESEQIGTAMFTASFVSSRERELPSWLDLPLLDASTLLDASAFSKYLGSERSGSTSFPIRGRVLALSLLALSFPNRG